MPEAAKQVQGDRVVGMYAIYDLVAGEIFRNMIVLFPHVAPARRWFGDALKGDAATSPMAAHPGDFALVYLGAVSIWSLSVIDVGSYSDVVSGSHRAVVTTGDAV